MLQLPGHRGADAGRVREEHPVRARGRRVGGRPEPPGLAGRSHGAGLQGRQVRRSPTATRRPWRSPRDGAARPGAALLDQRRPRRAPPAPSCGRAASGTATRARRTTASTAASYAARGPATGSRSGSPRATARPAPSRASRSPTGWPQDTRNQVIVIADEDYDGVNPTYSPAAHLGEVRHDLREALRRAGLDASVWDVSQQGVPHHLGVLSHFKGAVWYLGENRLTQDPEDETTETTSATRPTRPSPSGSRTSPSRSGTSSTRAASCVDTGETATYYGALGSAVGGIYYGLNGDPTADCVVTEDPFSDCLLLADDFAQYYLGRYSRVDLRGADEASRARALSPAPAAGSAAPGSPPTRWTRRARSRRPARCSRRRVPAVRERDGGRLHRQRGRTVRAGRGQLVRRRAARRRLLHAAGPHLRPRRASARPTPRRCGRSCPTTRRRATTTSSSRRTPSARTTGRRCPRQGGLTTTDVPAECEQDFLLPEHPFLRHYLTSGDPCTDTGTTGSWNAMTGSSDGWQDASFDLSAYAGKQVEISVSHVTDPGTGGRRCLRRRHQARRRRGDHPGRGLRDRARCVGDPGAAAGQLAGHRQLRALAEPVRPGDRDEGHRAARLRSRAARLARPAGGAAPEGVRLGRPEVGRLR